VELDLSPSADRRAAIEVGVDAARFDACLASTAPDVRIEADTRALEEAGMAGLPTTYVEGKRLLGAVPEVAVRDALDHAIGGGGNTGIPGPLYVPLGLALLALTAWLGRSRRGKLQHERSS
ncbi:MAG TPA: DsbA family protein, partial [Polyangiaceae bacterium]